MEHGMSFIIRAARPDDAEALRKIYAPYVERTAVSFEYDVPSVDEFRRRMMKISEKYPFLVAEEGGSPIGYANTSPFVGRAAYEHSAETTIYIEESRKGRGAGRALYIALESISRMQNILNLNACIGYTDVEDEYLTNASEKFHEKMGYKLVGKFNCSGYKFGRWYDMIWMEKIIGEHKENMPPVIPFPMLDKTELEKIVVI